MANVACTCRTAAVRDLSTDVVNSSRQQSSSVVTAECRQLSNYSSSNSSCPVPFPPVVNGHLQNVLAERPIYQSTGGQADGWPNVFCTDNCDCVHQPIDVSGISVDELAACLSLAQSTHEQLVVVIDCRTFISFNTNHIVDAFNAACGDRFTRKRLLEGRATVADLVSGGPSTDCDAKEEFRRLVDRQQAGNSSRTSLPSPVCVAYDDNTSELAVLPATHPLRLLTDSLVNNGHQTRFLKGGLREFHSKYSLMCSKPSDQPCRPFLYSPTTPLVELDVDSAPISQILPYIYIGNERDAACRQTLLSAHVSHVLNATSHIPLYFDSDVTMTYRRIPASDSANQNLKQYFDDVIEFIDSVRSSGGCVLVHCQGGVSRSPSIVIAYIIARYQLTLLDAFAFVKSHRQIIAPNFNFMGQLLDFEQRCRRGELRSRLQDVDQLDRPADMAASSL